MYKCAANPIWRKLEKQQACLLCSLAPASAGRSSAARIAIVAITTSNSVNVKAAAGILTISQVFGPNATARPLLGQTPADSPHIFELILLTSARASALLI